MTVGTTRFYYVTDTASLEQMLHELAPATSLEIDTETMPDPEHPEAFKNVYNFMKKKGEYGALDPHTSRVRLVQLRSRTSLPYVVDILKLTAADQELLAAFLREPCRTYLAHHVQFDLKQLAKSLKVWLPKVKCTMQMSIMMGNAMGGGNDRKHGLAAVARDYLGLNLDKTEQSSDWGNPDLTPQQLEYAALDVVHLHDLVDILEKALCEDLGMREPYELEMAVLPATARMEFWGIPVDVSMIRKVKTAALSSLPALKQNIVMSFPRGHIPYTMEYHGGKPYRMPAINLGSKTAEVLPWLKELGLDIEDVQRATLDAFRETMPGVGALVDFYNIEKQSQFDYEKYVHPVTGRIHGRFKPSGASTGRFSSVEPNLNCRVPVR